MTLRGESEMEIILIFGDMCLHGVCCMAHHAGSGAELSWDERLEHAKQVHYHTYGLLALSFVYLTQGRMYGEVKLALLKLYACFGQGYYCSSAQAGGYYCSSGRLHFNFVIHYNT